MAAGAKGAIRYLIRPRAIIAGYGRRYLRADLIAGLTCGVLLLPQGIAYAQLAELPPEFGLHAGIVGAIIGALWGSSRQLQTGPTNTITLIVLSSLAPIAMPGSTSYLLAAGLMTVLAGILQLVMGLARLGVLSNFVSHSVVVGFTAGAAVLIGVNQLKPLLGLVFPTQGHNVLAPLTGVVEFIGSTHLPTFALGAASIVFLLILRRFAPRAPAALLAMVGCGVAVALAGLDQAGVDVIGSLPRGLPPVADLPLLDLQLIGQVSTGALAVAAIGLTESMSIARAMASETGQRLDPNQELVGQGLANVAAGVFSGYAGAGSFSRSAVNVRAGAQTQMAAVFTGVFVLLVILLLAPLAATIPKTALAGVLIVTAIFMVDRDEIRRIWTGPRGDRAIMVATFVGTLFLPLEFAVVIGMLVSFGLYIARTSTPTVHSVLPDDDFERLISRTDRAECPELLILDIHGDLYFGAVTQIEEAVLENLEARPGQRLLLLRMHSVNQCDFSGIHMLESVVRTLRERGGDLYFTRVHHGVMTVMRRTGFSTLLGDDHFLKESEAIGHLFHKAIDPAICIYECPVRAWLECQNLPKRPLPLDTGVHTAPPGAVPTIGAEALWEALHGMNAPRVIDVREPREYRRRHIVQAELQPLPQLILSPPPPDGRPWVLVCRGGRRSTRAAEVLLGRGYDEISVLEGGMIAWEAAGLLDAADPTRRYIPVRPPVAPD